jgi:AcrR family transcriptional regulator
MGDAGDRTLGGARARILETAYGLFSRHGVHRVGIDRIVAEAGVAKMTLYRHYPSKEELVLAVLELRERRWTREWLQEEVERRAADPAGRLLAVFDVLDGWFRRRDYEGCAFVNTLLETRGEGGAVSQATTRHLETIRALLRGYAAAAGVAEPRVVAEQLQILIIGAIVSAGRGDRNAAARSREMARRVLAPA